MIVTTSPAASGSRRQPLISRITSRKSAATSAPETSRSAAFAAICGRSAGSGTGRACTPRSARRPTRATGAWSTKIDSQPKSCVRIPPIAGPTEAPTIPASAQIRAAEASAPVASESRSSAATTTAAPATPCTARSPTSTPNVGEKAHARDAAAKTTVETPNTPTGLRRARAAAGTAASASARLNEISAQASVETSTSNCTRIFGSASVTTDESARTSPTERPSNAIRFRDPSGCMSRTDCRLSQRAVPSDARP